MKLSTLKDVIIRTVWPYLYPEEAQTGLNVQSAAALGQLTVQTPPPTRITQQERFSTPPYGPNLIGRLDDNTGGLFNAVLLWRARGDEVIRSFACNKGPSDTNTWVIELMLNVAGVRSSVGSFTAPITITLTSTVSFLEVFPNVPLPAGSGLYARVVSGPVLSDGYFDRVDGIVEIERNARLP